MPVGTIEFKCLRVNLKDASTFEPDARWICSLIDFDLVIGDKRLSDLKVEVRQQNGTNLQSQPLEVGHVIPSDAPWDHDEFGHLCQSYYSEVIGSSGIGLLIDRGERQLVERVAIHHYRREQISLPSQTAVAEQRLK